MTGQADVIILGGGLVGLTLGVALDAHGLTSIVIDPAEPASVLAKGFDGRASAVASASHAMLDAIGVGARLRGQGCPIGSIRVSDGLAPRGLWFDADPQAGPLGVMYENRVLRRVLHEAAAAAPNVTLLMPAKAASVERDGDAVRVTTEDGQSFTAALLVGAEGRNSPTRAAAGINVARWSYDHTAIIATLGHERPHEGVAHEIFYPSGPFALLPMLDDEAGPRSAIVWTVEGEHGPAMLGLPDRAFLAEAEQRMGGMLGRLRSVSPRSSYPLGFHHTARITDTRLALVGDAAHGIHPIAGQGLNLGFLWLRCWLKARGWGSIRAMRSCSRAMSDGARLTASWSRPPPTRSPDCSACRAGRRVRSVGSGSTWSHASRRSSAASWPRRAARPARCPNCCRGWRSSQSPARAELVEALLSSKEVQPFDKLRANGACYCSVTSPSSPAAEKRSNSASRSVRSSSVSASSRACLAAISNGIAWARPLTSDWSSSRPTSFQSIA